MHPCSGRQALQMWIVGTSGSPVRERLAYKPRSKELGSVDITRKSALPGLVVLNGWTYRGTHTYAEV